MNGAESQLESLVHEWHACIAERDTARLRTIWHESYLSTGPDGVLITREQELASIQDPNLHFSALEVVDFQVRVFGDTAVVLGCSRAEGVYLEHDISGDYRFTTVFRRYRDGWMAVVSHGTQVQ